VELLEQLALGLHPDLMGKGRRHEGTPLAMPQRVIGRDVNGDAWMRTAGNQHTDRIWGSLGQQRSDARPTTPRCSSLILIQTVNHKDKTLVTFRSPLGRKMKKAPTFPVTPGRARRIGDRFVGYRGELLDHGLGKGVTVGLAI
jgi:hypothetical protein